MELKIDVDPEVLSRFPALPLLSSSKSRKMPDSQIVLQEYSKWYERERK